MKGMTVNFNASNAFLFCILVVHWNPVLKSQFYSSYDYYLTRIIHKNNRLKKNLESRIFNKKIDGNNARL